MTDEQRDELLVRIDERVCSLTKHFTNHIKHHWIVTVPLLTIIIGLVIALLTK